MTPQALHRPLPMLSGSYRQGLGSRRAQREAGFTLPELLVGTAAAGIILLGLVLGSIALQRSYAATDQYATAQDSELRVMDYITRDLRRAMSVTVTNNTQVSVVVPDYYNNYDSTGNPNVRDPTVNSQPLDPVITSGSPVYGTNPLTITYYVDPNPQSSTYQSLLRQVNWTASGTAKQSSTVIADNIQAFQLSFTNSGSVIQASITFAPIFERNSAATARAGTTLNVEVTLREQPL